MRIADIAMAGATPAMANDLTQIARAAKAHWPYPQAWFGLWEEHDLLAISETLIRDNTGEVAQLGGQSIGFYLLNRADAELDHLWVLPEYIGEGVGRLLFRRLAARIRREGMSALRIASDTFAEGFYRRMGAVEVGKEASIPEGRLLTVFRYQPED